MYLHTSMRLGSMLRPQGFGGAFMEGEAGIESCALGAALEAIGEMNTGKYASDLWPELYALQTPCPVCFIPRGVLHVIGFCLNDAHRWTREQIATWLEPIELAYYEEHPEARPKDVEVEVGLEQRLELSLETSLIEVGAL